MTLFAFYGTFTSGQPGHGRLSGARFAELNAGTDEAAERAGREPREIERSACLLVAVDPSSRERPPNPDAPALPVGDLGAALRTLAEGGADEAILVASPITEASIRELGAALPT